MMLVLKMWVIVALTTGVCFSGSAVESRIECVGEDQIMSVGDYNITSNGELQK